MVPTAAGANLDHIALTRRFAGCEAVHLLVGCDAATTLREPWTENVGDLDEFLGFTHGTLTVNRRTAELCVALQFTLAIADLLLRQRSFAPRRKGGLTGQAIVDTTAAAGLLEAELGSSRHPEESTPP